MSTSKTIKIKVLFEVPAIANNTSGSVVQTVLINGEGLSSEDVGVGDKVIYPDNVQHAKISGALLSANGMLYILSDPSTSLPLLKAGDELEVMSGTKHESLVFCKKEEKPVYLNSPIVVDGDVEQSDPKDGKSTQVVPINKISKPLVGVGDKIIYLNKVEGEITSIGTRGNKSTITIKALTDDTSLPSLSKGDMIVNLGGGYHAPQEESIITATGSTTGKQRKPKNP